MKLLRELVGAACLCALVSVSPAQAASLSVMTFDGLPQCCTLLLPGQTDTWVEDGITATAGPGDHDGLGFHELEGTAYLTDGGTAFPTSLIFAMQGRFDPIGFELIPTISNVVEPFDNVSLTGIRDGVPVAQDAFFMGTSAATYLFGESFLDLDSLVIAAIWPDPEELCGALAPCTGFNIDNVTLSLQQPVSPVPIPPSALLLLTALGLMSWRGVVRVFTRA